MFAHHMIRLISMPWRWFLGLVLLLTVLLLGLNWGLRLTLPAYLRRQTDAELQRHVLLAEPAFRHFLVNDADKRDNAIAMQSLAQSLVASTGLRVTVISADGTVLAESDKPAEVVSDIENHLQRPEIQMALVRPVGFADRTSTTVRRPLRYAAVAVRQDERVAGFVRVAIPLDEVVAVITRVSRTVSLVSVVIGLLAMPVVFKLSRRVTDPIRDMQEMAMRVASGEFDRRAPVAGGPELEGLGLALNQMSDQLELRLRELAREKSELNATLANMIEGVLVVDAQSRIQIANRSLQERLSLSSLAIGKTIMEALRSSPLQDLVSLALDGQPVSAREMSFFSDDSRVFDVNAACLRGRDDKPTGVVVVFHDITRIKKLENVRKEFVANVSHELRTPLSIIKGYVETLLDDESPEPATARQFLQTIARHSKRLEVLIGDLLTISALESQQARLDLDAINLQNIAATVIDELAGQAAARSITVQRIIPESIPEVRGDAQRIHQVFFNLLDNAIKYTQTGGQVVVNAKLQKDIVVTCVSDNGPGIAAEHLPHIFERFYRVDKARSRELGGTGLGLSIVKHIVQAHGGKVWAESDPDHKGSQFYFTLPRA
jgi:two-component system phosphate regulon sensor histidine kinase PhoR